MKQRNAALYALCFLLPAALLLAVYAAMGMAPFGDRTILAMDMADQYVEFFCALKHGDLFFSWSKALGTSYVGVFSYYVSSPLSLLTLLVPNESMPVGLMFLTVLKVGLAGLTYAIFAARLFRRLDGAALLGALAYSLCSWSAAYSLCIMWLDGLIWLPLILLGLERLLAGKSAAPFAAALTVCFISSWYISYMIGGFCLLWFICRAVCLRMDKAVLPRRLGRFVAAAVWALCASAWLWLPSFLSMFSGKLSDAVADYSGLCNFGPEFFAQFLPGQYNSLTYTALPFVFCGVLTPVLFLVYLFCRRFPLRERLASAGLLGVLLLSLWLAPLDKVWHLFKYPNWFPYRYAFLVSFVLVLGGNRLLSPALERLRQRRPAPARAIAAALTVLLCLELGYNTHAILTGVDGQFGYESYAAYRSDYTANEELLAETDPDGFYRVTATEDRGFNSPLSFGYPGITHYSSVYSKDVNAALRSLGFAQAWMWCSCYGSTPFTDALFSVRYVLSRQEQPGCQRLDSRGELALYETPARLPLVFSADAAALAVGDSGGPFDDQNALFSSLTGEEALFVPILPRVSDGGGQVTLTFAGTGLPIYADLTGSGLTGLTVDGQFRCRLTLSEEQRVHYLGTPAEGEALTVTLSYTRARNWDSLFYTCDQGLLAAGLAALAGGDVTVDGAHVTAEVTLAEGQALVTTIPAERGWTVCVDGEKTGSTTFCGAFLAAELPAGAHTVEFRYTAPGLYPGLALGAFALVWAAVLLLRRRRT